MDKISITVEEYKELLIIKGKYEELKSKQPVIWNNGQVEIPKKFTQVTCQGVAKDKYINYSFYDETGKHILIVNEDTPEESIERYKQKYDEVKYKE